MVDNAPPPPEAPTDEPLSLPKAVAALLADLPGLLSDRVHLLSLELRRASNALGQMVALGIVAAILLATAWIALWVGLAAGLLAAGLGWPWIVLLVLLINLSAAAWAVLRLKALAPLVALPATLRQLTVASITERHEPGEHPHD